MSGHLRLAEQHKATAMRLLSETPEAAMPPAARILIANLLLAVEQLILHVKMEPKFVVGSEPMHVGPGAEMPPRPEPVHVVDPTNPATWRKGEGPFAGEEGNDHHSRR